MKTSEFIKRWNESSEDFKAVKDGVTINLVSEYGIEFIVNVGSLLPLETHFDLKAKEIRLINSYLSTKPENRKEERKWVIPWGSDLDDGTLHAWYDPKKPVISVPDLNVNWQNFSDYQFTDSELEALKSTQSPAIAQAIDIAKELVSDD